MIRLRYTSGIILAALTVWISAPFSASAVIGESIKSSRESILDRQVHLEKELILDPPRPFRWCDRLDSLQKRRIDVGDAELYIETEGIGPPLVLINGGPGGTHHDFHPWFSRVAGQITVVYYDQRGCGLSDFKPGTEGYSVQQAVRDLDAIRRTLGFEKWVVLGYSYGGFLAQYYAVLYPEHTRGLILLGAVPGMWADTGSSRQTDFMSDEEKNRLREIRQQLGELGKKRPFSREEFIRLLIYNNMLNGDWKRQNFYRPSRERIAQTAWYEWVNDVNFNALLNDSAGRIDLTGVFEHCPIPTLILEGKWDLTWGEKKKDVLKSNHPNARMVVFEEAGHGIYTEDTERFFTVLNEFIAGISDPPRDRILTFKDEARRLLTVKEETLDFKLRNDGWGRHGSKKLAAAYSREQLGRYDSPRDVLRLGFALYDEEQYEEALFIFRRMEAVSVAAGSRDQAALAIVWQGHMLDLLDRRDEARTCYDKVVQMNLTDSCMHGQYGLRFQLSPYARERLATPFQRIENQTLD